MSNVHNAPENERGGQGSPNTGGQPSGTKPSGQGTGKQPGRGSESDETFPRKQGDQSIPENQRGEQGDTGEGNRGKNLNDQNRGTGGSQGNPSSGQRRPSGEGSQDRGEA